MKVKNLVYLVALLTPVSKRIGGVIFVLIVFFHLAKAQPYNVNVVPIGKVEEEHLELIKSSIQSYYNAYSTQLFLAVDNPAEFDGYAG